MKRRMLAAICGILALGLGVATAYVPMIREDRVWEYKESHFGWEWVIYHSMKFDGSTFSVNGKEYHVFTCIGKKYFAYDIATQGLYLDFVENFEGNGIKYFVREEPGKVYALTVLKGESEEVYTTYDICPAVSDVDGLFSERLIYDFNVPDSDVIESRLSVDEWLPGDYEDGVSWYVIDGDPGVITIEDEACRFMCIIPMEYLNDYDAGRPKLEYYLGNGVSGSHLAYPWIEGIGVLYNGCLAEYEYMTAGDCGWSWNGRLGQRSWLNSVYNTDGTVVFGNQPAAVDVFSADRLSVRNEKGCVRAVADGAVELKICGVDGAMVGMASGEDEVRVDTSTLPHGIYLVTAVAGAERRTVKVAL